MPITRVPIGESVRIRYISGRDEVRCHLASLGFVVDQPVTVVNHLGGNLILQVKESRIALGQNMARRILV